MQPQPPPTLAPPGASSQSDLVRYVRLFIARKWIIVGTCLTVMVLTGAYLFRQTKIYAASASVIIDVTAPRFLDNQVQDVSDTGATNYWFNREYFETQYKVIQSRAVSLRVVQKLGLDRDAAFLGLDKIKEPGLRAEAMDRADPTARLQGMIRLKPVKDSRIVMIGVEDTDANRAALLANEVAEAYIQENLALRLRISENASQWLEDRLADLQTKSEASEIAVYDFKKQQDMLTTSLEDRQSMVSQRLITYNNALTDVRTRIAALKARVDTMEAARKTGESGDEAWALAIPAAKENATVEELKRRFLMTKTECGELVERYLDQHPKLMACQEKLKGVREDLVKELGTVARLATAELAEATAKEKNLVALFEQTKAEAFDVNKKQIDFERIKREADNNQRLHALVLKRLKDIELSGLLRTSNVRVLDSARPSFSPVYPRPTATMPVALVIGLLAGMALSVLLDMVDSTLSSQADVEKQLGLAFLGFVPVVPHKASADPRDVDLYVHRQPKSAMAECCRAIRTNLLFMQPDRPLKRILVSSSSPQEGKSTTVLSLGIAMAQSGNRVLVVDTDMRRPRLHRAFGVANDSGVSSIIVGAGSVEDSVKSTDVPNLFVLPCGPVPPNPAELLHTEAFKQLLATLSEKFDRVILDSPPVGAVADAAVLATQADGVLLVLRAGQTNRALAQRAVKALRDVNARVFGAILNQLDVEDPKYGEYYYAYQRYGYYYGERKDQPAP